MRIPRWITASLFTTAAAVSALALSSGFSLANNDSHHRDSVTTAGQYTTLCLNGGCAD
ncbi:hypothetical protein [Streptomyces leeuwenhoekii]|uniref:Secreted Protein n=1 Tax=Streptomyces leeuwenhoekii TaxID=1437453 RepID=A0A0F7VQ84_STRLW|nr:hypothetical protein [Streptomyces leeuwenhoekii]CQR59572.1 Hypothetical Protein sle_01100 [Streptomyces leeuwenhoekii]